MPMRFTHAALIPLLRPVLPWLVAGTLTAALSGLAMLAASWCVVQFVAEMKVRWVITALGLSLACSSMASLASWLSHYAEADFAARLRRKVASHLASLPSSTLAHRGCDALRRMVSDDIAALHHMIAHLPSEIATFAAVPLPSIVLLVAMAGSAALLALLPGVLAALYYLVWMPRISARYGTDRTRVMGEITTAVDDYVRGIHINRIYGTESGALATYHNATARFTRDMVAWVNKVATPAAVATALLQAAATFAIAYAVAESHDASTLGAALFFSLAIVTPALRLGHGLDYVAAGQAAAGRLTALLQEQTLPAGDVRVPEGAPVLDVKEAVLTVNGRRVLDRLNYRFVPGTLTAITGPSGAGKTTLLRALAGLEPLDDGAIYLAGANIAKLDAQARQSACLLVPQGDSVLPATVRENLALSAPDASDERMVQALARAQIDVSLEADTTRLSGGERQRVGIARAFLAPASVILLDEPTSALDDATAIHLMMELGELSHDRDLTLVMVTHDLALAARADAQFDLKPAMQPETQP